MEDAWLLARRADRAGADLRTYLAEFGFTPYNPILGPLPPQAPGDGGDFRPPGLLAVVADPGEPVPLELCRALLADHDLADAPLLLAVEPEHLDQELDTGADELVVWPFSSSEL